MSQSEKRYFKLEASKYSGKGANDYLKLYELIDKQEDYDEKAIKKMLKGRKMLKRFAGVKNYLYNMILKSLTQYHSERNSHQRISSLLQQVDILFGKGLYKPAAKLLGKARKIADQYEKLSFQILISEWEHPDLTLEERSKEFFQLVKYYNSTNIHMALGNFEEVNRIARQFKPRYKKILEADHKNRLFFVIPVNLALAHFILENYDESLFWIRNILNYRDNTIRKDSMGFVRVLHLLVQYELNNRSIMEYYIDSTHRFLVDHAKYGNFERILLRFIKQISNKSEYDEDLSGIFEKTRDELAKFLEEESYAQLLLDHYHLLEWFESKVQQRPMLEVVMNKIKSIR